MDSSSKKRYFLRHANLNMVNYCIRRKTILMLPPCNSKVKTLYTKCNLVVQLLFFQYGKLLSEELICKRFSEAKIEQFNQVPTQLFSPKFFGKVR